MGDVIGAQAIVDASERAGSIPVQLLTTLLERPPRLEALKPGSRMSVVLSKEEIIEVEVDSEGKLVDCNG
jgi:hypothetical protein